jgi:hypothetical protein
MRTYILVTALVLLAPHAASAQAVRAAAVSAHVAAPAVVPHVTLDRIEAATARRPSVAGGVAGAVVGAVAGGVVGCMANRDDYGVFCGGQSDTKVAIGAIIGAGIGAYIGARLFARDR